jgi:hypothetical protein
VDIFDYEFMRDSTGAAIIVLLKRAMGLIQGSGSARTGLVQRV